MPSVRKEPLEIAAAKSRSSYVARASALTASTVQRDRQPCPAGDHEVNLHAGGAERLEPADSVNRARDPEVPTTTRIDIPFDFFPAGAPRPPAADVRPCRPTRGDHPVANGRPSPLGGTVDAPTAAGRVPPQFVVSEAGAQATQARAPLHRTPTPIPHVAERGRQALALGFDEDP